ncbi:ATP-binding cassette domain-containing protein [Mariniluteicoccus flavus]
MTITSHSLAHDTGSVPVIACSAFNATVDSTTQSREGHAHPLVDGVSVNLERGSFTAVTGRPRSGARELVHAIAGQRALDAGRIFRTVDRVAFVPAQLDAARLSDAVARALATDPEMVVVDTFGWANSPHVLSSLRAVARQRGITVVLATDDLGTAIQAERVLVMQEGRLVDDL